MHPGGGGEAELGFGSPPDPQPVAGEGEDEDPSPQPVLRLVLIIRLACKRTERTVAALSVRLNSCSFQNKKPALITQQNCVIRADFFRGATLIYLFASSVETTLVIP